jgi:hypothetical protein
MVSNDSRRRKPLERKELYRGSVNKSDSNPNLEKQSVRPENVKLDEEDTGNGSIPLGPALVAGYVKASGSP